MESKHVLALGKAVIQRESEALQRLNEHLGQSFTQAVEHLAQTDAVFFSGIGKPYLVGQKIAASMASMGIRASTIHPVDALHGDIGLIHSNDAVILASNSGQSIETLEFARALKNRNILCIAITADTNSPLAQTCDVVLDTQVQQEADPHGIVPTASTAALMALGDALCIALAEYKGDASHRFAHNHPAGALGRRHSQLRHVMRPLSKTPMVSVHHSLSEVLQQTSAKRAGAAFVCDSDQTLVGIFTDGDLRRGLAERHLNLDTPIGELMTRQPLCMPPDARGEEALALMREKQIDEVAITDPDGKLLGFVDIIDVS